MKNTGKKPQKATVVLGIALVLIVVLYIVCPDLFGIISDTLFNNNFRVSAFAAVIGAFVIEMLLLKKAVSAGNENGGITKRTVLLVLAISALVGGVLLLSDRNDKFDAPYIFTGHGEKCLIEAYEESAGIDPDQYNGMDMQKIEDELVALHRAQGRNETFAPLYQLLIVMILFAMGYLVLDIAFKGRKKILSAFMSFPLGAAMACVLGLVFIIAGIPFRRRGLIIAGIVIFAALFAGRFLVLRRRGVAAGDSKAMAAADYQNPMLRAVEAAPVGSYSMLVIFLAAAVVVAIVISGRLAWFSPDSVTKTMYGVYLAEYDLTRTEIFAMSPYGYIEPIIHCIAWKFNVDFLYSFYPLMAICSLGIMASALAELSPGSDKKLLVLVSGLALIFLASNYDFATLGVWILSNGTMGTYTLIIVVCLISAFLARGNSGKATTATCEAASEGARGGVSCAAAGASELAAAADPGRIAIPLGFAIAAIVTSRVEGACFVILLLVLALGIKSFRDRYMHVPVMASAIIILWNLCQLIFFDSANEEFWDPSKGIMMIAGAAVLVLLAVLSRIKAAPVKWIMRHWYILSLIVLAVTAIVSVSCTGDVGTDTLRIFARHFATSDYNNSAALWSYLLLLTPLIISAKKKTGAFAISVTAGYLLLLLAILCFRIDTPSHLAIGDSGRRIMQQVMPSALFLASFCVLDIDRQPQQNQ